MERAGAAPLAIRRLSAAPTPSARLGSTDVPCIVQMQQMLRGKTDVLSLAQGIVHWPPPAAALDAARDAVGLPQTNAYCADDGLPELRDALKARLAAEKGLVASEVMVTAGANQGYTNLVLSLLDAGDAAVLFRPYYFNHLMALQMTGSEIVTPASTPEASSASEVAISGSLPGAPKGAARARCAEPPAAKGGLCSLA